VLEEEEQRWSAVEHWIANEPRYHHQEGDGAAANDGDGEEAALLDLSAALREPAAQLLTQLSAL
jgi:hypothetical protein